MPPSIYLYRVLAVISIFTTAMVVIAAAVIIAIISSLWYLFIGLFSTPSIFPPVYVCSWASSFFLLHKGNLIVSDGSDLLVYHSDPLNPSSLYSHCCGDQSSQALASFSWVQPTAPHFRSLIGISCFLTWATCRKLATQTCR